MGPHDVQGEMSQDSEILWGVVFPAAAKVFLEHHVERTVQAVLAVPMLAREGQYLRRGEAIEE